MEKQDLYKIFVAGIDFGIKYGPFPFLEDETASIFDLHKELTPTLNKDHKSVTYTVIVAGFNYGSNLRSDKPNEEYIQNMFENLIQGKPLEKDDSMYYMIKDKIDKLLTL